MEEEVEQLKNLKPLDPKILCKFVDHCMDDHNTKMETLKLSIGVSHTFKSLIAKEIQRAQNARNLKSKISHERELFKKNLP